MSPLERYYDALPPAHAELLLAVRAWLLAQPYALREEYKWSTPCFAYGGRHACYLYHQAKSARSYVAFPAGRFLEHPLLRADGRKLIRVIDLAPEGDLPLDAVADCLGQQIRRIEAGGMAYG